MTDAAPRAGITARMANYFVTARPHDLPEDARHEALRSFVNIVGCMLGGARHEAVSLADDALLEFSGKPEATLIGRGRKSDVLHAALINCFSSNIHGFNDTHDQAVVHPSGPVAAAILTLSERKRIAGPQFLLAFALGVDAVCRLSKAISVPPAKGPISWSQTGVTAGIGAAVGAGRLLDLNVTQMQHAIGIALSEASGFRALFGSMTSSFLAAHSAHTGLRAAILAQKGFTSSETTLEGKNGFLDCFCEEPNLGALTEGLGTHFEISHNTYKPYPCGAVIHPIIDACLDLRRSHNLNPDDITAVKVRAAPKALALTDRPHPKDELDAHVSLQHWVAISFIRGTTLIEDMDTEGAVLDPGIVRFQDNVEAVADDAFEADGAEVQITLRDGRSLTSRIEHCIGSAARPMTDRELDTKFIGLAESVVGAERARDLLAMCWDVESSDDVGALAGAAA